MSFDSEDFCRECGEHLRRHTPVQMQGEKGTLYVLYHCPDLSLPDAGRDDDPWDETPVRPTVSALFDPYD